MSGARWHPGRIGASLLATAIALAGPLVKAADAQSPSATVAADETEPQRAAPSPAPRPSAKGPGVIGIRAFGIGDVEFMLARQTFADITGSSRTLSYGGGGDIVFAGRPFLRVTVEHSSAIGVRGVVGSDGTFVPNGISERITMAPLEIGVGWRFGPGRPRTPRGPGGVSRSSVPGRPLRPRTATIYAGAGVLILRYSENSPLLDVENTSTTFRGLQAFGGVDVRLARVLTLGVEGEYRSLPNALGGGPTSAGSDLGETNLGGFSLRVMFGVRLGRL